MFRQERRQTTHSYVELCETNTIFIAEKYHTRTSKRVVEMPENVKKREEKKHSKSYSIL